MQWKQMFLGNFKQLHQIDCKKVNIKLNFRYSVQDYLNAGRLETKHF